MKMLLFLFALLVTAVVLLSSCGTQRGGTQQVGEMQRESRSIQAQDAQAVRSKLQMGAGELNITGGADQLMEGEFSYNVSNWKPKVSYDVSGERGALTVKQGSGGGVRLGGDARNEWDISLNDEVPTDLVVQMGAGELNLTGGADQLMEGEFSYNVSDWKPKVSYDVSGERGELVVKQGSAEGGDLSGGARNEWDISLNDEVPTELVVQMGAGESDLDLDSLTVTGLDLQMGAGKSTVDLTGDYAESFDASIEG